MIFLSSMQTRGLKINYLRLILLGIVFIFLQLCLRCYAEDVLTSTNKVVLPPFFVEEKGPHWNYASAPGLEVLTRCDENITLGIVKQVYRAQSYVDTLLPKRYQVKKTLPRVLLLYPHEMKPGLPQGLLGKSTDQDQSERDSFSSRDFRNEQNIENINKIEFFPNLDLRDPDVLITFFIAPSERSELAEAIVTPQAVQTSMLERLPALPWWFTLGFANMYRSLYAQNNKIGFKSMVFVNPTETALIEKNSEHPRFLPPIKELFSEHGFSPTKPDYEARRSALFTEAELFIRWVYSDPTGKRRDQLFSFVDKTINDHASESTFFSCFGLNYTELWERLCDYVPDAITRSIPIEYKDDVSIPNLTLRLATESEIGQIKGDWQRFEAEYVKKAYPAYSNRYLQEARLSLQHAHDRGGDSATLFTIRGLLELHAGDSISARAYLEDASKANAIRPHAYYELTRLRYDDVLKHPEGTENKLSEKQVMFVLEPLLKSKTQEPRPIDANLFLCRLIIQSSTHLNPQLVEYIQEGIDLYPRNIPLLYLTAGVWALHSHTKEAKKLLLHALSLEPDDNWKPKLVNLLSAIN